MPELKRELKVSVAIPTYKRPDFLRKACRSILHQTRLPNELLLIARYDDEPTIRVIEEVLRKAPRKVKVRRLTVREPGFLPPVLTAVEHASGDILALMDDDAEAHPDWLENMLPHYADPSVGGVGGRCINYFSGVRQHYPPVKRVGRLYWYGRSIGNMYCDLAFDSPVDVDFLMGGNMSYRLDLFRECKPDSRIGMNVAFHWEMDVGQQVKKKGYRIVFDPKIAVDHHSAPREVDGLRTMNYEGTYWNNYNYALLMRKHLSSPGMAAYVLYSFLAGDSQGPGGLYIIYSLIRRRPLKIRAYIMASLRGRLAGLFA